MFSGCYLSKRLESIMELYVRKHTSSKKNNKKLKHDKAMKKVFMSAALLSSSMLAVIVIFIALKGITPFVGTDTYEAVNVFDFLFHTFLLIALIFLLKVLCHTKNNEHYYWLFQP